MGDDGGKSPQQGVGDVTQALKMHLPEMVKAITDQYGPEAAAEFGIANEYSPKYAQLQADILGNQGKKLAAAGDEINAASSKSAAQAEADIANGSGQDIVAGELKAAQMADPEYYASRPALLDAIKKNLDYDPDRLNAGESESVARGLGRTSTFVPSALETAKNAMTFGQAGTARRSQYQSAIQTAAQATNALRGPVNAASDVHVRSNAPNPGTAVYTGIQTPGVNAANQAGSNLTNVGNTAMNINMQKQKSDWEKYMSGLNATTSTIGAVGQIAGSIAGCWIARAVYGQNNSRWLVFRGWLVNKAPSWFRRWYMIHGPAIGRTIERHPLLRAALTPILNLASTSYRNSQLPL